MDEPTAGVDPVVRHVLLEELLEVIQDETRAVLFSSHIVSDIKKVADLVTFIVEGRIVLSGDKEVILEKWRHLYFSVEDLQRLAEIKKLLPYVKVQGSHVEAITDDFSSELLQRLTALTGSEIQYRPLDLWWSALDHSL